MDAQGRHLHVDPPGVGGGPHAQVELFKSGLGKNISIFLTSLCGKQTVKNSKHAISLYQDRPNPNGSLVRLVTEKSETKLVLE